MKKILSFLAVLALLTALCVPALAAEPELGCVTDAASLLSDQQWATLEGKAEALSAQYECGIYIITLDDFTDYVNTNDVYEAAKAIYREYSLGWGAEKSGVLLMLSMAERDYSLIAYGYGNTAFTDYGKDQLAKCFLDNFGEDDWYGGFSDYLNKCGSMLSTAREGHPLDVDSSPQIRLVGILISLALGCLAAMALCCVLCLRMKSVAKKAEADSYVQRESVQFIVREDHFTHASQTRTMVESSSGSGGGGTTVDSDGFSGHSGKF